MAQKKSTPRKVTQTSKRPYTRHKKEIEQHKHLRYEIIVMSFIAIGLFLILSVYFKIGGVVGEGVRNILFGTFGLVAYFLPIAILGFSIFKIFNIKNQRLNNKLMLVILLIPSIASFVHILYIRSAQINIYLMGKSAFVTALVNYYSVSAVERTGGGFIGGFFGDFFSMLLGKGGSIIVLLLINLSLIILLTEKSLFKILKVAGNKMHDVSSLAYQKGREAMAQKREINLTRKESVDKNIEVIEQEVQDPRPQRKQVNMLQKSTLVFEPNPLEDQQLKSEVDEPTDESDILEVGLEDEQPPKDNIQISLFNNKTPKKTQEKVDTKDIETIKGEINAPLNKSLYEFPPLQLLKDNPFAGVRSSKEMLHKNAEKLEQTLESFGVQAKVVNISYGPTVTRYELQPDQGVKVSKIVNLSDDIALNLAASGIRMEAPIPGKSLIGIEVPNKEVSTVHIKEVIDTIDFMKFPSKIAFALGKDISGETIIADIARMPHMLISGSTGSGKSVCINTLITSILYKANPNEVKLLMIDPKVVELKVYNGIPHLLIPVVTDPKKAAGALYWAVQEMSERYQLFANANVRDLVGYNKFAEGENLNKLPQIVIIVDELADLMQVAAKDVEDAICRLAQMARAAGIHLILATQRPSVDVITGIIKANIPSRIAFAVSSGVDSRTIIDMNGAEKLVGKGDMLYYPVGMPKPIRVQGAFISDKEVERVVEFLKASQKAHYDKNILDQISRDTKSNGEKETSDDGDYDSLFEEALELVIEKEKASASMIQRRFRVGYNRAARIIDQLYDAGYIGQEEGSKPRKVNLTMEDYYRLKHEASDYDASDEELAATDEEE